MFIIGETDMKRSSIILFIAAIFIITSCGKNDGDSKNRKNEVIQITNETIESYSDEGVTKQIIEYVYEKSDDIFWQKAVYKDSCGNIVKQILREFNDKRFPIIEKTEEDGKLTELSKVNYSEKNYELLSREVYTYIDGDSSLSMKEKFVFDDDGYLLSHEIQKYTGDKNFKNIDGNSASMVMLERYFPGKQNRPRCNKLYFSFVENGKWYLTEDKKEQYPNLKIGDLMEFEETKFNEEGLPYFYKVSSPECSDQPNNEWYNFDKDPDKKYVTSITGFMNESLDSSGAGNTEFRFEYDENGMISKIEQFRYNPQTGAFDIFHDQMVFSWVDPKISGRKSYIDLNLRSEHRCTHSQQHMIYERKVAQFDSGVKIITESRAAFPIDNVPENPKLILKKKITQNYHIIDKK
jgi:hypothetical protein